MALRASSKYIAIQKAEQRDFLVFTNGFPEQSPAVFSYDSRQTKSWEHLLQQIAQLCPKLAGGKCRALYDVQGITKVCSLPELEQKSDPRLIAVGGGHLYKARYGGSKKEKDKLAAIGFEQKPYSPRPLPLDKSDTHDIVDKTDSPIRQRKKNEPYRAKHERAINGEYRHDKDNDKNGTQEQVERRGERLGSASSLNERRRRRSDKGGGRPRRASAHSERTLIHDDATVLLSTSAVTGDRIRVKRAARTSSAASSDVARRQRADSDAGRMRNGSDAMPSYRPRVEDGDRRGSAASDQRLRRRRPSAMAKQSSVDRSHKLGSTERKSDGTHSSSHNGRTKSKQPSHNSDPLDRSDYGGHRRASRAPSAAPVSAQGGAHAGGRYRRRKARSTSPSPRQRAQKKIIIGCFLNGEEDKFTPFKVDMVRPLPDIISDVSSHFDRYGRLAEIETGHIVSDSYELRHRAVYLFIPITEKFKDIHYNVPGGFVIRD